MKSMVLAPVVAILLLSAPAFADESAPPLSDPEAATSDIAPSRAPRAASRFRLVGNVRVGTIADSGFDQIAGTNAMPAVGLEATGTFFRHEKLSLAAGFNWDFGGRQGDVRNVKTQLSLHHLLVPIEARFALTPWLDLRARLAPGASYFSVDFGQAAATTNANGWAFSTEAAVGTSLRMFGNRQEARTVEMWGLLDAGYLISTTTTMEASRTPPDAQLGAQASTNYGQLSPRGGFIRFGLALAF